MNNLNKKAEKFIFYKSGEVESDMNNYLFVDENSPQLQYLYLLGEHYQKHKVKKYEENPTLIKEYNSIIDKIAHFIKDISGSHNVTDYYTIFSYLLWNGYLSKDKQFIYTTDNLINEAGLVGFYIMLGRGCCRNIADLFNKVLCALNIDSHFLINSSLVKNQSYVPNIYDYKRNSAIVNDNSSHELDKIGNHASVLVKEKGNFYIYDPTNLLVYKVDESLIGSLYNGVGECHIKPWGFIMFENLKQADVLKIIFDIEQQVSNTFLKDNEVKDMIDESINECKKNKSLVLDLHADILNNLDMAKNKRR